MDEARARARRDLADQPRSGGRCCPARSFLAVRHVPGGSHRGGVRPCASRTSRQRHRPRRYSRGVLAREPTQKVRDETELTWQMIKVGWGRADPVDRRVFTTSFIPGATEARMRSFDELQRRSMTPDMALASGRARAEYREAPPGGPACPIGPHHRSADLPWPGPGVAGSAESRHNRGASRSPLVIWRRSEICHHRQPLALPLRLTWPWTGCVPRLPERVLSARVR